MPKSAIVLLAPGCEEIEYISSADILRRAKVDVTVAAVSDDVQVVGAHELRFVADKLLKDVMKNNYDAIVMPGGMGALRTYQKSEDVATLLREQQKSGRIIAAICAAPLALATHKICSGKSFTCYPSMEGELGDKYQFEDGKPVVVDGNLITSRGPGTASLFGLTIVRELLNDAKAKEVAKTMLIDF